MTKRPINVDLFVNELHQTVTAAGLNYEIWWVHKNQETRAKYVETMRHYNLFFQTSIHAHFVAMLIALYRLYETRGDTFNIPHLLKVLRAGSHLDVVTLDGLNVIYEEAKPLWVKVNILRNKVFGHRDTAHTIEIAFKEAAVTPNELNRLVKLTEDFLNRPTLAWKQSGHAFNLGSGSEARQPLG